jgi:hypothetical protein
VLTRQCGKRTADEGYAKLPMKMIKKLSDLGRHAAMVRFGGFCITLRYITFAKLAFDPSWICLGSLTYFFC